MEILVSGMTGKIILLALGIGVILLSFLLKGILSTDTDKMIKTSGVIEREVRESGTTEYYVRFVHENKEYVGKTETYTVTNRKYSEGDSVGIYYGFAENNGNPYVIIDDPDLISARQASGNAPKWVLVFGIALCAVAIGAVAYELLVKFSIIKK